MPKTNRPTFRAKTEKPSGETSVYFIARFNGLLFKVYPGERVDAGKWQKDKRGKGNGRMKTGMNEAAQNAAINDRLDIFEKKLYAAWNEAGGDLSPAPFREKVFQKDTTSTFTISNFISSCLREPDNAYVFREKLGHEDKKQVDTFIKELSNLKGLRAIAHGKAFKVLTLREYFREFVQKLEKSDPESKRDKTKVFRLLEKHIAAYMNYYGEIDFADIDWKFYERFISFAYSDHSFDFDFLGKQISYEKKAWGQGNASKHLQKFKQLINEAVLHGHTDNTIIQNRRFSIPSVEGNKAPIYVDEVQLLEGADFSGKPTFANVRLLLMRGFLSAVRYSDLHKVNKDIIRNINGEDVLEVWAQKTGRPIGVPLWPVFKKSLMHNVDVPKYNYVFNDQLRELATFLGLTRPVPWTSYTGGERKTEGRPFNEVFSAHDLRRSAATFLVFDMDLNSRKVMPITGHSQEASFNKYLCPSDAQLNAASLSKELKLKNAKWLMREN